MSDLTERPDPPGVGSIQFGTTKIPVTDPHAVETVFVDAFTSVGELNGIASMTLATFVFTPHINSQSDVEAVVCARLRFNLATALDLRNALDGILAKSVPAKDKTN